MMQTPMKRDELLAYRAAFENELRNNILSYWMTYAVDERGDGFYGAVDLQNCPVPGVNRSCVLNARILWAFSAAAKMYKDQAYGAIADRAYDVLTKRFFDAEYGGFFMELSADNQVANAIKHTYAQAFALYALCKYYEFRRSESILQFIQSAYRVLEAKTKDRDHRGYREAFTRDWQPIAENRMADNNEPKSMNTHLHVLEAYTELYRAWREPLVSERLEDLLELFLDRIIRGSGHLGIFFDDDFQETEASKTICSFGHDIEASWLLWETADLLGEATLLQRTRSAALKMLDAVDRVGLDKDGGMFLESVRSGSHVRTNKHWWIQAETLVGFMNGYELTGNPKYWERVKLSWDFIDRHVIDHDGGEWFTKVSRLGKPFLTEPPDDPSPFYRNDWKIDPWKCPYHNGRACMELIQRIDRLVAGPD